MYVGRLERPWLPGRGLWLFGTNLRAMERGMENVRRYRALASTCRQQAALDPENYSIWIARADQWERLVEAEIEEHYRACNSERDALVAA
jgi:hypothetical protein